MRKRHFSLLLAAIVLCITVFCLFWWNERSKVASSAARPEGYHIQVILKAYHNPPAFWRVVGEGIAAAEAEFGVKCEITAPDVESDIEGQIALMRAAIAKKPDAIVLASTDYDLLVPACKEARAAGIHLITIDSDVNFEGRAAFIGTDNYTMGTKLGTLLEAEIGSTASFGVIGHVASTSTAKDRLAGLLDGTANPSTRMAALAYCDGDVAYAKQLAMQMLEKRPEIRCMVGLNESSALGIVAALEALQLTGKVGLVVGDSSEQQIQSLENGTIQACVVQNPFSMGYLGVATAIQLINKQAVPAVTFTDTVVVNKDALRNPQIQQLIVPFKPVAQP